MADEMLDVQPWPPASPLAFAAPRLLLLYVDTPAGSRRDTARGMVREVLREVLGAQLHCPPAEVPLVFAAGQAPRLDAADARIGVSVAHEPGLSLIAIRLDGAVGIDLLRCQEALHGSDEIPRLAQDYLGPESAGQIALLTAADRAAGFATAWTRLEAGLKCRGLGLTEWTSALQQGLSTCRYFGLRLPSGFFGTLALAG